MNANLIWCGPAIGVRRGKGQIRRTVKGRINVNGTGGPILVAIDFSDDSDAAAAWAIRQADAHGLPLSIIHVVHDPVDHPGFYRSEADDINRPMGDVAKDMLDQYVERLKAEAPASSVLADAELILVRGLPPTRIVEAATTIGASQIVMGCRGLTGVPHLLLGSQAERVIHLSPIPVTVVKAESDDDDTGKDPANA